MASLRFRKAAKKRARLVFSQSRNPKRERLKSDILNLLRRPSFEKQYREFAFHLEHAQSVGINVFPEAETSRLRIRDILHTRRNPQDIFPEMNHFLNAATAGFGKEITRLKSDIQRAKPLIQKLGKSKAREDRELASVFLSLSREAHSQIEYYDGLVRELGGYYNLFRTWESRHARASAEGKVPVALEFVEILRKGNFGRFLPPGGGGMLTE